MRRAGFTLIEVTLAVVLTGIVALLVYGTLAAAAQTEASLGRSGSTLRAELAWRATVTNAVRNVRSTLQYAGPTLLLEDGVDAHGHPADRLTLLTAGDAPPLVGGADWRVSLGTGSDGLGAEAVPMGTGGLVRHIRGPARFTGMDVQALAGGALGWRPVWPAQTSLPVALRITFWTDSGPEGPPLLLVLPLTAGP